MRKMRRDLPDGGRSRAVPGQPWRVRRLNMAEHNKESWHLLAHADIRLRKALEPWSWVWTTVEHVGGAIVQLALWNGSKFLTANGQVPIYGNVIAYQRVAWPEPFKPEGGDSDGSSREARPTD